jgi:membrane-bound serine protease (ClpP class)
MNRLNITDGKIKRLVHALKSASSIGLLGWKTGLLLVTLSFTAFAQKAQPAKVMVMEIKNNIDPRMQRYVELALAHAEKTQADIVLIEMDTYGGGVIEAENIVEKLLAFKKPVWIFINTDAASAGAFISIACDSIYMTKGASFGAATVVYENGEKAMDKYQSHMRAVMRSTAEANHRDPRIAEGMVDDDLEIEGIKKKGQIITFSTSEAIKHGYCEGQVGSIEEILKKNNVAPYDLDRFQLSAVDKAIDFFLNPAISGLLILIIIAGIYFEMQAPGLGFAGLAALVALVLYLVPYYLNGIAENWEIIAFFVGLLLIAVEVFVLPGFGVAGVAGITITAGALVLIMVNNDAFNFEFVAANDLIYALTAAVGGILGGTILLFVGGSQLSNTRFYKRVALTDTQQSTQGYTANFIQESMKGKKGVAQTVLRPSGRVLIDGTIYDAVTRGEYIEKGTAVEVVEHETTSLKVKQATA